MNAFSLLTRILLFLSLPAFGSQLASIPTPSPTCEPVPDYLYQETFLVEVAPLPEGIQVRAPEVNGEPRAVLVVSNQTDENLFVLSIRYAEQLLGDAVLDPEYDARLRYAHEVASYLVPVEGTRSLKLDMNALADLDPDLVDHNRLELVRPQDAQITIPAGGNSMLLLVHGKQVYTVPFAVKYHLNTGFSPRTCPEEIGSGSLVGDSQRASVREIIAEFKRDLPVPLLVILLLAVALIFSLFTLIVFRLTRRGR